MHDIMMRLIGRFVSQDPKGFAAGDANLYRYVANDPTNATGFTVLCKALPTEVKGRIRRLPSQWTTLSGINISRRIRG